MIINEIDLWDDRIMLDGFVVGYLALDADPLDARKFEWLVREIRNDPKRTDEIEILRDALEDSQRECEALYHRRNELAKMLAEARKKIANLEKRIR